MPITIQWSTAASVQRCIHHCHRGALDMLLLLNMDSSCEHRIARFLYGFCFVVFVLFLSLTKAMQKSDAFAIIYSILGTCPTGDLHNWWHYICVVTELRSK